MKIDKKRLREKCKDKKFYDAVKYMSHCLKGKDRAQFIKIICHYNIYLASKCAHTCERDENTERYIKKCLNLYFEPHRVSFYNNKTKMRQETIRKIKNTDVLNYLMASCEMGNFKAVETYINKFEVDKLILVELGSVMNENELIDFIWILVNSKNNANKIRGIGSSKNLFLYKNDDRIKLILKKLWYIDKSAFTQLAYDTGWLKELGNKIGPQFYIRCFEDNSKPIIAVRLISEVLYDHKNNKIGLNNLLNLFIDYSEKNQSQYIYLLYYLKIKDGDYIYESDSFILNSLGDANTKIINYYVSLIRDFTNFNYYDKVNYFEFVYACRNIIKIPNLILSKNFSKNNRIAYKIFEECLIIYRPKDIMKIIYLYLGSYFRATFTLDELWILISQHYDLSVKKFLELLDDYEFIGNVINIDKEKFLNVNVKTKNYMKVNSVNEYGDRYFYLKIIKYDYIEQIFYVDTEREVTDIMAVIKNNKYGYVS